MFSKTRIAAVAASTLILGGVVAGSATTANAGSQIESGDIKNQTIQSVDIAKNGVGKSEIRKNAVGSNEIKDESVYFRDLTKGARERLSGQDGKNGAKGDTGEQGPKGDTGEQGPAGPAGADGANGADGADGVVGNILHNSNAEMVPAGSNGAVVPATCAGGDYGEAANGDAEGYVAVGGGFTVKDRSGSVVVNQSRPLVNLNGDYSFNGKGWMAQVNNTTDKEQEVRVWTVCVYAPSDDQTD